MSNNAHALREQGNDQRFEQLAQTLHQFRSTVDNDIHGAVAQDDLLIESLNNGFALLSYQVRKSGTELRNVLRRNSSLTKIIIAILVAFMVMYTLYKMR